MWKGHRRCPSPTISLDSYALKKSLSEASDQEKPLKRSTIRLLTIFTMACSVALWFHHSFRTPSGKETTGTEGFSLGVGAKPSPISASERCESRRSGHWGMPTDRQRCGTFLPDSMLHDKGWLVGVHIDRSRRGLFTSTSYSRQVRPRRGLPHLYFVQALGAVLQSIASVEPRAKVNVALFTEGRWGGLVDETGLLVELDVAADLCEGMGLSCSQVSVQTVVWVWKCSGTFPFGCFICGRITNVSDVMVWADFNFGSHPPLCSNGLSSFLRVIEKVAATQYRGL